MKKTVILIFTLYALNCFAQDEKAALITDRPDQTESAAVVPLHSVQFETGFTMAQTTDLQVKTKSFAYNSTLIRFGLLKILELRLGMELLGDKILSDLNSEDAGFSPLYTGAKLKIAEEKGLRPDIAILGGLFFPFTASEKYKPDRIESTLRLAFAHSLSEKLSLGYNFGTVWNGYSAIPDWIYSVSLGISIAERVGLFIESYGTFPEVGETGHLLDAGLTFLLLPNLQFDTSGGIGIYKGLDHFISVGLTWRIPH